MNMDSATSSEEDEYEQPTQPQKKGGFKNDAESFPTFGGGATQAPAASTMDFSSAWASSAAPTAMPEVVSRPKSRNAPSAASTSDAVQGGGESAPTPSSVPWRPSDWGHAMSNVPRWSGPAPGKFSNQPHQDPYTAVKAGSFQAPKERMPTKAQMAAARAEAASPAPEPEKPKKEKKVVQKPKEDSDGFTSVAPRKPRTTGDKPKQTAVAVDTYNPMAALQMDEPVEKKEKAPKPAEAPKQESKGGKKKKEKAQPRKEKAQPPKKGELKAAKQAKQAAAKVEPPKAKDEQREQKTKKKSGGKKVSKGKGGGGGGGGRGQKTKTKDAGLPIAWVVAAAVVAAGVAFYFAKTQI